MNNTGPVLFKSDHFSNRRLWEVLPNGSWKNKPCFVIGGGPSLEDFHRWDIFKGKRTIGVNRAYEKMEPTILFSMDTRFLNWILKGQYGDAALKRFNEIRSYKVWLATYTLKLPDDYFIIPVYKSYRHGLVAFTFDMTEGLGHGNNSGFAALNLAVCLGANPIYLLGFDCKHKPLKQEEIAAIARKKRVPIQKVNPTKSHWHGGHPIEQRELTAKSFISYFDKQSQRIKSKGFKVINLSPDSALDCFEKRPVEEVLN